MNNKKVISLILGLMCLLLTYGIAIQIKTTNATGTRTSTNARENELRDAVLKYKEKYDNLFNELEEAEKELETQRTNATQNNSELEDLENTIKDANKALGLTEVTGNGVIVTLDDNRKLNANSNYIGDPNKLIIHYDDVIRVVNELKNAGAEAISINDQRVISTTSIECDGNVIKVNGTKIGTPITIKAIGLQERLMALDRYMGYLMVLELDGVVADIERADNITIPKYTGVIKFNYAESK